MALLERARTRLQAEYVRAGKAELYEVLRQFSTAGPAERTYSQTAAQMGISENTLKSLVRRLRQRYRRLLRHEIGQTVSSSAEVDEEIRYLMEAASS
jgi:RNA polymerase sigma-70 factor (ECF subfamily)